MEAVRCHGDARTRNTVLAFTTLAMSAIANFITLQSIAGGEINNTHFKHHETAASGVQCVRFWGYKACMVLTGVRKAHG